MQVSNYLAETLITRLMNFPQTIFLYTSGKGKERVTDLFILPILVLLVCMQIEFFEFSNKMEMLMKDCIHTFWEFFFCVGKQGLISAFR